jgi:hypothetical protein
MRTSILALTFLAITISSASAGLMEWSSDVEEDPFSGGIRVTVDFMSSLRSGVLIICDSSERGLLLRTIPGFTFEEGLSGFSPEIEIAIDGQRLLGQSGETGSVGDNLAVAQVQLTLENSRDFVKAFADANKQVAIKDGISDRPHLLTARGSTKAGAQLVKCMEAQAQ